MKELLPLNTQTYPTVALKLFGTLIQNERFKVSGIFYAMSCEY